MHVPWFGAARVFFFFFATVCVWGVVVDGGSWLLLVVLHVCALTKDTPEPWMVWDARSLVVGGRLVCCSFFFFFSSGPMRGRVSVVCLLFSGLGCLTVLHACALTKDTPESWRGLGCVGFVCWLSVGQLFDVS